MLRVVPATVARELVWRTTEINAIWAMRVYQCFKMGTALPVRLGLPAGASGPWQWVGMVLKFTLREAKWPRRFGGGFGGALG